MSKGFRVCSGFFVVAFVTARNRLWITSENTAIEEKAKWLGLKIFKTRVALLKALFGAHLCCFLSLCLDSGFIFQVSI